MDTITVILEGLRVILGFLLLLFVPGFALSLVIFPRFSDIGMVERLAYSTVLSIGSVIALVLFMDVVLGVDTTPVNIIIVITVFSCFAFFEWLCMVWYRKSTFKDRLEPRISADYQKVQSYYTREINAARDRFRQDTRTVVVYHEHQQSGLNHIDHSYLMDVGEEIAIQQVVENKLKVTDSVILQPPYPRTRYFELVIREYKEDGLSLVDDLQIYPALITRNPDRKVLGFVLQRGTTHITGRMHTKTSTTEVEWIYSHDFHVFAITHAEDTLDQMVDRIVGTLDQITLSMKSGIHISSHAEDRQMLKDAFDAVIIEKPRAIPAKPQEIAQLPEVQFSAELWEIPKRPEIPAAGVPKEITERPIILTGAEPADLTKRPEVQIDIEPKEIPKRPIILTGVTPKENSKPPAVQTWVEPKEIPKRPEILTGVQPKDIQKPPEVQIRVEPEEIPKRPEILTGVQPKESTKPPEVQTRIEPKKIPKPQEILTGVQPKEITKRPEVQTRVESEKIPIPQEVHTESAPIVIPRRPVVLTGVESEKIPIPQEVHTESVPIVLPRRPGVLTGVEPKELPKRTVFPTAAEHDAVPQPPVIKTRAEPKEIPQPPKVQARVELKELPESSDVLEDFELKEIQKQPAVQKGVDSTQIVRPPEIQFSTELMEIFRHSPVQHRVERKESTPTPKEQHNVERKDIVKRQEVPITIEPKVRDQRKLQKEILRDLDVFSITPDSFGKSEKNIENIIIPKKADVPKKLAEIQEDKDIDWLDLEWLYEEEK